MKLYQHNKEAYEKVMSAFRTQQKAAIVHATGTGKSYIIAAVVENFNKCIVIAPNNFVLNETKKVCKSGVEFRTYASMMYEDTTNTDYDIIVLDEFHRSGAEKWGEGVRNIINANPNAKLLGTSATHIRYLDNARNMADEMFDGNVVSYLSIKEAIDRNILPDPIYVASLYEIDTTVAKYKSRIIESKNTDVWKDEQIRHLNGIASNWENSKGVPSIISKYFDKDMKRIIVFCSKVSRASEARKWLGKWFGFAGYKHIRFYNIDYTEKRLEKEMEDFQEDVEEGTLKVAISVNMLNEGVHIPRVDGIIMLRSTISRIIIEQQIGRCLTAENKTRRPVVLDLVNNMDLIDTDSFVDFNDGDTGSSKHKKSDKKAVFPFKVIDECRDLRTFFAQLEHDTDDFHLRNVKRWEKMKMFYAENGRLPKNRKDNKELYDWMYSVRNIVSKEDWVQEIKSWLEERGFKVVHSGREYFGIEERLSAMEESIKTIGSLGNHDSRAYASFSIIKRMYNNKHAQSDRKVELTDEQKKRFEAILNSGCVPQSRRVDWTILSDFCHNNNRLPVPSDGDIYRKLSAYKRFHEKRHDENVDKVLVEYGFDLVNKEVRGTITIEMVKQYIIEHIEKYQCMPKQRDSNLMAWMYNYINSKHDEDLRAWVSEKRKEVGQLDRRTEERLSHLEEYYKEHGHLPCNNSTDTAFIRAQKELYKQGKICKAYIDRMRLIGILNDGEVVRYSLKVAGEDKYLTKPNSHYKRDSENTFGEYENRHLFEDDWRARRSATHYKEKYGIEIEIIREIIK